MVLPVKSPMRLRYPRRVHRMLWFSLPYTGLGFRVSGFGFRVSGFRVRV